MPASNRDKEFVLYVVELMQSIGPVSEKSMFGGHGIYLEGLMFALVSKEVLYLKADKDSEAEFIASGLAPFVYSKGGKVYSMSYYQAPDETLEDADAMNLWANKAYGAALRAAANKTKSLSRPRGTR